MTTIPISLAANRLNWPTLLRLAAVGDLILLLTIMVGLHDLLALALAIIVLLGLALLRFRGGLPGTIILALVFADLTIYTLTGAVSNARHNEDLLDLILPASLAALSMAGLVAAAAILARRRNLVLSERAAPVVALAAVAFFVLLVAAGLVASNGVRPEQAVSRTDLALETVNMAYSATELAADAGQVTVSLANHDLFWHTFTIDELNVDLQAPVRGERQVTFTAEPGTYPFYCAIPGHALLGMEGTLTIR
jgi:plastocyanin